MLGTKFSARFHFKFLVEATWINNDLKLTKVSSILNQLGIEDHTAVDEFLQTHFNNLDWDGFEEDCVFFFRVDVTLWKAPSSFSRVVVKFVNLDSLLKDFFDLGGYEDLSSKNTEGRKLTYLSFGLLPQLFWSPEDGYLFSLNNFFSDLSRWAGTFPGYKHRREMLGRTTNFRRKLQKKKFEEY